MAEISTANKSGFPILEQAPVNLDDPEVKRKFAEVDKIVSKLKVLMYRKFPYFGMALAKLKINKTFDIPTMAVDCKGNIFINPDFTLALKPEEVFGVLAHEVMHVLTLTLYRLRGRDMKLWNIATDYIMNRDLDKDGFKLPEGGLIPDKNGMIYWHTQDGVKHSCNISEMTAEQLYQKMHTTVKQSGPPKDGDGEGEGSGGGMGIGPTDENGKALKNFDDHVYQGEKGPSSPDGPKGKDISEADAKNNTQKIINDEKVQQAKATGQKVDQTSGGEKDTVATRKAIIAAIAPKTNWKQLLRSVVMKGGSEYSWRKPNKRALGAGYYAPVTRKTDIVGDIICVLDTSGSMGDREVGVILAELLSIFKSFPRTIIRVFLWSDNVYYDMTIGRDTMQRDVTKLLQNIRVGGNDLTSVKTYIEKKNYKPKAIVYFTDLGVEANPQLYKPTRNIFLLTYFNEYSIAGAKKSDPRSEFYSIDIQ